MTKGRAIALGALTAWPFAVPAIGLLFEATGMLSSTASEPPAAFVVLYAFLLMTPIVVYALLVFYLVYLFTTQMPLDKKLVWAALLVIGHVFTMPVFWYRHIWKPRGLAPLQASLLWAGCATPGSCGRARVVWFRSSCGVFSHSFRSQ